VKVPRTAVLLAACAVSALGAATAQARPIHQLLPDGRTVVRDDRFLPPADPIPAAAVRAADARHAARRRAQASPAARAAAVKKTFASTVEQLHAAGAIDDTVYATARTAAADTRSLLRKLPAGARKNTLADVLGLANALAAKGQLTAGRVPVISAIVGRNAQYWTDGALLSYGARVTFPESRIVWQYYPGAGLEPQWVGTFGAANAQAKSTSKKKSVLDGLSQILDEALALASPRAGGIAWESFFSFSGAAPVWVSGLSQGTAVQALSRASVKLARPDLLTAATNALGVFKTPAPEGVALARPEGTHYLIYSTNSKLLVINAFLQSLIGLYDYAQISQDPVGLQLFAAGDKAAQVELPAYDTGAWSLYEGTRESDLSYHQLVTGFLSNLCDRTQTPIYCTTATRFTQDETTPPAIRIVTSRATTAAAVPIRFTLSKMSSVKLSVDGTAVSSATLAYGTHTLTWGGRRKSGPVTVAIDAKDVAGNSATVSKVVTLQRK
jgi:D-glucuronyl C5-epimerase C-terminus